MNRSFLLAVDESREQTGRIIHYQNRRAAGEVDEPRAKEYPVYPGGGAPLEALHGDQSFAPKIQPRKKYSR